MIQLRWILWLGGALLFAPHLGHGGSAYAAGMRCFELPSSIPQAIRDGQAQAPLEAGSCAGDGFDPAGAGSGSAIVAPAATAYELASTGAGGTGSDTATVTVAPPPGEGVTITDVTFDWTTYDRLAIGSDNWPCAWADDDNLYCAWGDGGGFGGTNDNGRVSLGFARVEGPHDAYIGRNVWGGLNPENPANHGGKVYAITSVNGVLWAWGCVSSGPRTSGCTKSGERVTRLWRSDDHAATWTDTGQELYPDRLGRAFGEGNFINFGRDNAAARDGHVYAVWPGERSDHYNGNATGLYLTRVPAASIGNLAAYEHFTGMVDGVPTWSPSIALRKPPFSCPGGTRCVTWAPSVVWIAPLQKFVFMTNSVSAASGIPQDGQTELEFWQADDPWGPWTLVKRFVDWRPPGASATDRYQFFFEIPTKWVSADGLDFTFLWTGRGRFDAWNEVRGRFTITGMPSAGGAAQ